MVVHFIKRKIIPVLNEFVNRGQVRTVKFKKNVIGGILTRSLSILISLLLIPITIEYINTTRYGIWLTLSSIVAWLSFFDIGLTQGLRNKFAEAVAIEDFEKAQTLVSTSYAILGIVFAGVWLIFALANGYINWSSILNIGSDMNQEVGILAMIVFTYFCLQFVLRIVTTLLTASQQPAKSSLIDVIGQFIALILVFILIKTTEGSLLKLGLALCVAPLLTLIFANVYFFRNEFHRFRPMLSKVDLSCGKELFNLGIIFFFIQISGIIQYESANIIIANRFGTSEVTSYNIVFKYFGVLDMIFIIFLMPFWSAVTEAYLKKDFAWIKNTIRKYNILGLLLLGLGGMMLFLADDVYRLWLGKGTVNISFLLSFWAFAYFILSVFVSKYVAFLNGISALRIQFLAGLVSPIFYIVLVLYMINSLKMGVYCVFVAAILASFNSFLLAPIQYYQIVYRSKGGIWVA